MKRPSPSVRAQNLLGGFPRVYECTVFEHTGQPLIQPFDTNHKPTENGEQGIYAEIAGTFSEGQQICCRLQLSDSPLLRKKQQKKNEIKDSEKEDRLHIEKNDGISKAIILCNWKWVRGVCHLSPSLNLL